MKVVQSKVVTEGRNRIYLTGPVLRGNAEEAECVVWAESKWTLTVALNKC
jgi:hypothetical protein